jgi:multidrug resistance efflux pump
MRSSSPTPRSPRSATYREAIPAPSQRPPPDPTTRTKARRRLRVIPFLITLTVIALAVPLGWAMGEAYMGAPWTRDSAVRLRRHDAPEVAGRIVELPVVDNSSFTRATF